MEPGEALSIDVRGNPTGASQVSKVGRNKHLEKVVGASGVGVQVTQVGGAQVSKCREGGVGVWSKVKLNVFELQIMNIWSAIKSG